VSGWVGAFWISGIDSHSELWVSVGHKLPTTKSCLLPPNPSLDGSYVVQGRTYYASFVRVDTTIHIIPPQSLY